MFNAHNARSLFVVLAALDFISCADNPNDLFAQAALQLERTYLLPGDTFNIQPINPTFLGKFERNYYGDSAPARLDVIWKTYLGAGVTIVPVGGGQRRIWEGAGWTGQPLLFYERGKLVIIQGCYDHHLKKLDGETGKVIWQYEFDDVLKGTGTFWVDPNARDVNKKYVIMQGSRLGNENTRHSRFIWSFRAISFLTGEELWRFNSIRTDSYARDVDASALIHSDNGYIGLENGILMVFDPSPEKAEMRDGYLQPRIYDQDWMYSESDIAAHGNNLVAEASPTILGNRIYVPTGAGYVYGYNMDIDTFDWVFYTGSDIDGTMPVTHDSCLLLAIEKQYIPGKGGVFKLDPSKPADSSVVWYFPTENRDYAEWEGGIIGSVTINDETRKPDDPYLACFTAIDGNFYVVEHTAISKKTVKGPNLDHTYPTTELVFKYETGPAISTPIIVGGRMIVATYEGLYLFEYDDRLNFKLLDKRTDLWEVEATPVVHNGRVYLASRNGYLYCFGEHLDERRRSME